MEGIFTIIRDSCFVTAHWIFATKIWSLSRELPLLLKKQDLTEVREQNSKVFRVGFFIAVTVPAVYNIDYALWYSRSIDSLQENGGPFHLKGKVHEYIYFLGVLFTDLVELTSAVLLINGIRRIRETVKDRKDLFASERAMCLNVTAFALVFAGIASYVIFVGLLAFITDDGHSDIFAITIGGSLLAMVTCVSQMILFYIFRQLRLSEVKKMVMDHSGNVQKVNKEDFKQLRRISTKIKAEQREEKIANRDNRMSTETISEDEMDSQDGEPEFMQLITVRDDNRATFNMKGGASIDERIID